MANDISIKPAIFLLGVFRIHYFIFSYTRLTSTSGIRELKVHAYETKIKFVLFKRTFKMTKQHLLQFLVSLLRFWDISICLICKFSIFTSQCVILCIVSYRRRLYIFVIDKRNHLKIYMFGVVGETRIWLLLINLLW